MPWPPQDDTPPKPPENAHGMRRDFSPLVKLAMRMGWITNLYSMTTDGTMPAYEVMLPFSYVAAYDEGEWIYVFGVVRGEPMSFKEPKTLFPTDGFVARLKAIT